MVNNKIGGNQRICQLGLRPLSAAKRITHGGQIDHARHAGKILKQNARRAELNLLRGSFGVPFGHIFNVGSFYGFIVFEAKQIFEQNLDGVRDAGQFRG